MGRWWGADLSLSRSEIGLIKGLLAFGYSQQVIIAAFSHPWRTVHHNLVSDIARGTRYNNEVEYPAAGVSECLEFLWSSEWGHHSNWIERAHWYWLDDLYLRFRYSFHPVGQGIFCSGCITRKSNEPFRWVFDCGTERGKSSKKNGDRVRREIAALASEQAPAGSCSSRPHIDLVALSHFDEDHLSGMVDLLKTFSVETLLLPYLTPWDRLVVALEERAGAASDLLNFLLDPLAFVMGIEGGEIERILLVPPSSEGPAFEPLLPLESGDPEAPSTREAGVEWQGKSFEGDDDPLSDLEDLNASQPQYSRTVEMLPRGAAITIDRAWEFVPYNDASLESLATPIFRNEARKLAEQLLDAKTNADRQTALDDLTKIYDARFKTPTSKKISPERRNKISLFLYGGPIGNVQLEWAAEYLLRHRLDPIRISPAQHWFNTERFGQILTGDGYLKTTKQWSDFETFYAPHGRLRRGAIIQVMHHGSRANWHSGIAAKLDPLASIFCSDPAGKLAHPDEPVLMDFASYNVKQVDAFHGWSIHGAYKFR